jgi:hypothetical protein
MRLPKSARDRGTVDPVTIADHVRWDLIPGERLSNFLRDPFGRRVRCHIDPDKLSSRQADNDRYVELDKADGWTHQQIHGSNVRNMIAQKGAPTLPDESPFWPYTWRESTEPPRSELEQLAVNVRRTPKPIALRGDSANRHSVATEVSAAAREDKRRVACRPRPDSLHS